LNPELRIVALSRFAFAITLLNIVGHFWLGFEQSLAHPLVSLAFAYGTEFLLETLDSRSTGRPARYLGGWRKAVIFLLPAHITGLACAMLLYTNSTLMPVAFAATTAIASKYLVRVRINGASRHVLNPSNFGITMTLLAFSWVGIAMPYMFTERLISWGNWVLPLIMICSGTFLNYKLTRRMPLIVSWLGAYVLQAYLRAVFGEGIFLAALMPMTGVAFILFTFYMVTDPSTTPQAPAAQVLFGASVAGVYGLLVLNHIVFGLFYALTIVCLTRAAYHLVLNAVAVRRTLPGAASPALESATAARGAGAVVN
jgi:enediyne biosynthesis protein E5